MDNALSLKVERNIPTFRELTLKKMKEAIFTLQFKPGDRLVERQLCDTLGVSRTVVREVLRHLETEGLVDNQPHRGPIVAKPTSEEIRQIYELRGLLEGLAARVCAEICSPETIAALENALDEIRKAHSGGSTLRSLQATTHFYFQLFEGAGRSVAWQFENSLQARINHLRAITIETPNRRKSGPGELDAIVKAIRLGRPDQAYQACVAHVERASLIAQQYLDVRGEPSEPLAKRAKSGGFGRAGYGDREASRPRRAVDRPHLARKSDK